MTCPPTSLGWPRACVLALLLLVPACGHEPAEGVGAATGSVGPAPVPLSGRTPAHVVGAVTFDRFHLMTTSAGGRALRRRPPAVQEAVPAPVAAASAAAQALYASGRCRSAAAAFVEAAALAREAQRPRAEEDVLEQALVCYEFLQQPVELLDVLKRLMALQQARKDSLAVARTQADLGCVYGMVANHGRALDHLGAAADAFQRMGMSRSVAQARANTGLVYLRRAEYGPALDALEVARALLTTSRNRSRRAYVLGLLGSVYESVGDTERAGALYDQALTLHGSDSTVDVADVLGNLGNVYASRGETEEALQSYDAARVIFEEGQDHAGVANALFSMGRVKKLQGGYATALELYHSALDHLESDSPAAARTLAAIAETYLAMGRPDDALDEVTQALERTDGAGARMVRVELLVLHALASLRKEDTQGAVLKIRAALDLLMDVAAGLADEHMIGVREHNSWAFTTGLALALQMGRPDLAAEFLEHGRAGALLEGLGGRGARRGLSDDLVEAETRASHALAAANRAYQAARAGRKIKALRASDAERTEAQSAYRSLQQRIQREAKHVASVFHPVPDSLVGIRAGLGASDVLVLYALLPFQAYALIVTADDARIQWIGNTEDIQRACEALRVDAPAEAGGAEADVRTRVAELRALVLDPLQLYPDTKHLLISPDGPLCYVPFPLLLGTSEVEVACLPSGTTLRLLREEQGLRGEGVLALGDPEYVLESQGGSLQIYAQGAPLEPLPATRAEVIAITGPDDARLLGTYATVRGLAEMAASRTRWRVIHLACHGLIDPRIPTLSSLALTPEPGDDGFLTALEVYGMHLPADLVVLSGCNTGRGRYVRGEGMVGLMRAFMCAGAPRVIVSLWKVDDEATRALMTRFHHLWHAEGMPTARALREAQRTIAADARWSHPRFWGAWVLWGLIN